MNSPIPFGTGNTRVKKICCGGACADVATHTRRTRPTETRILMSSSPAPTLRDVCGGQKDTAIEVTAVAHAVVGTCLATRCVCEQASANHQSRVCLSMPRRRPAPTLLGFELK